MINEKQARKYCREDITLIENYAEAVADKSRTWICHHRNAEPFTGFCAADLKKMNMYLQRPASELKFVTRREHRSIHNKGNGNPMYGKHLKDVYKPDVYERMKQLRSSAFTKLNKSRIGIPLNEVHKQKISRNSAGRMWFTNGVVNKFARTCPEGFVKGRIMKSMKIFHINDDTQNG